VATQVDTPVVTPADTPVALSLEDGPRVVLNLEAGPRVAAGTRAGKEGPCHGPTSNSSNCQTKSQAA